MIKKMKTSGKESHNSRLIVLMVIISFSQLSNAASKCEPLRKDQFTLCRNMPYNETMFPNLLDHRSLDDASAEMAIFAPLIKVVCAKDLEFFLCSVYAPVCMKTGPLPPCRDLCERARDGCVGLMNKFGFLWPDYLRCSRYPVYRDGILCVHNDNNNNKGGVRPTRRGGIIPDGGINGKGGGVVEGGFDRDGIWKINSNCTTNAYFDRSSCPSGQQKDGKHYSFMGKNKCAAPCKPLIFSKKEKEFARNWVLFWSIVCMISTAFTLMTFIVDMPRFRYPERPIIFLSGCYFIIAIAFIAGPVSDKGVACHKTDSGTELLNQGTENAACTIVFMLLYFFLMSASIWFVILTLTWFLAAGLKWGHEAIEGSSQYFHAAAWAIPAAKTIAILAMNQVDGDILSGTCFVGGKNLNALRGFVLAPLFVYLIVGILFLLAGFLALIQIRKVLKEDSSMRIEKLTRLMVRIGIFSILYSLPAIIVIACLFYEQSYRDTWERSWKNGWARMILSCPNCYHCRDFLGDVRPDFAVFMIKYLMLLMVGITSGFWIWSGKTLQSWKRFYYNKLLHQRVPRNHYESKDGSGHTTFTTRTSMT